MTRKEIESLINKFNEQVGSRAWTSARAEHDTTIIDALKEAGIDISAIYNGTAISFSHKIALNENGTKLIVTE